MTPRFEDSILEALMPRGSRILTHSDLTQKILGAQPEAADVAAFERALYGLERRGAVVRVRGEKLSRIEFTEFQAGTIVFKGEGKAFLLSGIPRVPDTPIARGGAGSAMDGDFVLVRLEKARKPVGGRGPRPATRGPLFFGTVVKVLVRRHETVVGKIARGPDGTVLQPFDRKIDALLRIPDGLDLDAPTGMFVEARITAYPDDKRLATCEVIEKIGFEGDVGVDVEVIARKWRIPRVFGDEAMKEAEGASGTVSPNERAMRADYTKNVIVTIDGETARDFDDAIEAEFLPGGGYRIGIHIADVSWYVPVGSPLDAEALDRGTSVYFPDRAVPMLPERLSNDLCSLRPNEERRTVSAILTLDDKGETVHAEFTRSLILSKQRLTYTKVADHLNGQETGVDPGVAPMLAVAAKAAKLLRGRRERRGALDFDLPDADVILGETGDIVAITKAVRNEAHRLIEEFMLAANEAVAKHLVFVPSPTLYRVHDKPDETRLIDLRAVLEPLGYHVPEDDEEVTPQIFQKILDQALGQPEERFVSELVLRAQKKALYSEECRGHYALAAPYYAHFTSPIRRYPDLLVHRALVEWIATRRPPKAPEAAGRTEWFSTTAGPHCSERERRAESAEREARSWKKFVFLSKRVGEEFEAYVSGVTAFGLFVVLSDIYVEGLVPMDALEDDFYRYEDGEHRLVGTSTGRVFRLGDVLRVKLITADFDRRQLAFKPVGHSAGQKSKSRVEAIARNTARRTPRTPAPRTGTRKAAPKKGRRR